MLPWPGLDENELYGLPGKLLCLVDVCPLAQQQFGRDRVAWIAGDVEGCGSELVTLVDVYPLAQQQLLGRARVAIPAGDMEGCESVLGGLGDVCPLSSSSSAVVVWPRWQAM